LTQFTPVVFPQPGSDTTAWARSMLVQLDLLQRQLMNMAANGTNGGGGDGGGISVTPIETPSGDTIVNTDGEFIDGLGRVIVSADGITIYDLVGFKVVEGPNIVINTDHLANNAVATAKLASGAITATKIATDAIESPHVKAGAITAGKLAVNAIVANDGVIGNAAIANAQIADLSANKILAGDIAAERMSANIVTALNGKFATLSALVASLGIVRIQPGGALLTQNAISEMSGDGVWIAENKFRAGNPTTAYIRYDGTKLTLQGNVEILSPTGTITMAAGEIPDLDALAVDVAVLETATINNSDKLNELGDDDKLTPADKKRIRAQWDQLVGESADVAATASSLLVSYSAYLTVFQALGTYLNGGTTWVSGYPLFISDAYMNVTHSISGSLFSTRLNDVYTQRQILLNNIASAAAAKGAQVGVNLFKPDGTPASNTDLVATWNKVNNTNITTFFNAAAIGTAQIQTAAITNALIQNLAVDNSKIANLAVDAAKIAELSVGGRKLQPPISGVVYVPAGTFAGVWHGLNRYVLLSIVRVEAVPIGNQWGGQNIYYPDAKLEAQYLNYFDIRNTSIAEVYTNGYNLAMWDYTGAYVYYVYM